MYVEKLVYAYDYLMVILFSHNVNSVPFFFFLGRILPPSRRKNLQDPKRTGGKEATANFRPEKFRKQYVHFVIQCSIFFKVSITLCGGNVFHPYYITVSLGMNSQHLLDIYCLPNVCWTQQKPSTMKTVITFTVEFSALLS